MSTAPPSVHHFEGIQKSSRRPTEELKELDEGYGSMPQMEDSQKSELQLVNSLQDKLDDRIASIDPETSLDSVIASYEKLDANETKSGVLDGESQQRVKLAGSVTRNAIDSHSKLNSESLSLLRASRSFETDPRYKVASIDEAEESFEQSAPEHPVGKPSIAQLGESFSSVTTEFASFAPLRKWAPITDLKEAFEKEAEPSNESGLVENKKNSNSILAGPHIEKERDNNGTDIEKFVGSWDTEKDMFFKRPVTNDGVVTRSQIPVPVGKGKLSKTNQTSTKNASKKDKLTSNYNSSKVPPKKQSLVNPLPDVKSPKPTEGKHRPTSASKSPGWFKPRDLNFTSFFKKLYRPQSSSSTKSNGDSVPTLSTEFNPSLATLTLPILEDDGQLSFPSKTDGSEKNIHKKMSPLLKRFVPNTQALKATPKEAVESKGTLLFTVNEDDEEEAQVVPVLEKEEVVEPSADVGNDNLTSDDVVLDYYSRKEKARFESTYKVIKNLGSGGHSTVQLASRISDGKKVVCKFIHSSSVWHWHTEIPKLSSRNRSSSSSAINQPSKLSLDPSSTFQKPRKIPLEIHMMRLFNQHRIPNLVRYYEHFEIGTRFIIVIEYLGEDWIDLYDYIEYYGPVKETHAKDIFRQVVEAVNYMHELGYCHNDIKDENVMIHPKTREIRLIDFGSTTRLREGYMTTVFYGTKKFAAPESIEGKPYRPEQQEVWALGTLLYVILFKMDPFKTDEEVLEVDIRRRIQRIRSGQYCKSLQAIPISQSAATALEKMMEKNGDLRPSVQEILSLEFFDD